LHFTIFILQCYSQGITEGGFPENKTLGEILRMSKGYVKEDDERNPERGRYVIEPQTCGR